MPLPPKLTTAQRLAALEKAKLARVERAEIKARISSGEISIFEAINDQRDSIQRMKILELISAVPGIGKIRAESIMERHNISSSRRIAGLGIHQRNGLRGELSVSKVDTPLGNLIVISGPGGVGKSTITSALRSDPRFWVSVSATTREPRLGEKDGVDYFFYSEEKFNSMIEGDEFLEWAEFAGNRYGTPKEPVLKMRELGKHVILEIEIAGARQVRKAEPSARLYFISPPDWNELVRRLTSRGTDSPERRAARLALAEEEMAAAPEFDRVLVNDEVDRVLGTLISLATSEAE